MVNVDISRQKFHTQGCCGGTPESCVKDNDEKQISVINALCTLVVKIDFRQLLTKETSKYENLACNYGDQGINLFSHQMF
jgi:hypothetical protein